MPFPIPFHRRQLPPDAPAIVRMVSPQNLQANRHIFKAPPLSVRPPTTQSIGFVPDIRDKYRAK